MGAARFTGRRDGKEGGELQVKRAPMPDHQEKQRGDVNSHSDEGRRKGGRPRRGQGGDQRSKRSEEEGRGFWVCQRGEGEQKP